jgi:hypothetical protein
MPIKDKLKHAEYMRYYRLRKKPMKQCNYGEILTYYNLGVQGCNIRLHNLPNAEIYMDINVKTERVVTVVWVPGKITIELIEDYLKEVKE